MLGRCGLHGAAATCGREELTRMIWRWHQSAAPRVLDSRRHSKWTGTAASARRHAGAVAFASFILRLSERYFVICSERPVVEHRRRKMRARPLLDPFAQGRTPSAPCTLAPRHSVNQYQDWRCKQLYRSCLAGVRPDHPRSCGRQFLPTPFRQLGALSRWGALLRSLATELAWR